MAEELNETEGKVVKIYIGASGILREIEKDDAEDDNSSTSP